MKRQQCILIVLAFFFLAPGLCAYLIYTHPGWIEFSKTNKGELLKSPQRIVIEKADPKKWHLVLWQPEHCDEDCLKTLDKLAKIRLSLGRHWYAIDQWLLGSTKQGGLSPNLKSLMREQAVYTYNLRPEQRSQTAILHSPAIFLVNPDNYWIMCYRADTPAADIYSDLKKILGKN